MAKNVVAAPAPTEAKTSKKAKGSVGQAVAAPVVITVKELAEEFGIDGRVARVYLRKAGLRAPAVESEGFGPRSKYQWDEGSPEIAAARKAIEDGLAAKEAEGEDADGE